MHAAASLVNPVPHPAPIEPAVTPSALRELTSGLARGDDAAWTQFHREHGPGIFRHLLAQTHGDYDLAGEALQQTYLRVARYVRPCDAAPMFASWLRTVARSALNDLRRRRRTFWQLLRRRADDASSAADPADADNDSALSEALETALARLTVADRTLLEAKYFTGLDVRTLATQLELSPKAVESRLTRARAELRRRILGALTTHE